MKLFRILLSIFVLVFTVTVVKGQNCADFIPQKEGTILKYVSYDKKGKVTGSSEMSFKEKTVKDDWADAVFMSTYSD